MLDGIEGFFEMLCAAEEYEMFPRKIRSVRVPGIPSIPHSLPCPRFTRIPRMLDASSGFFEML